MSFPLDQTNKEITFALNGDVALAEKHKIAIARVKEKMSSVLLINEVFHTIQGEGKSMGHPVVFIRTYGCNLRCGFANKTGGAKGCDTPYTWDPSATEVSDKNRYTPEMLIEEISLYASHNHWVVSGGEPLLQGAKFIGAIKAYKEKFGEYPFVEFETNGTVIPAEGLDQYVGQYNVSLKLENSNATEATGYEPSEYAYNWNTRERRVKPDAVKYWINNPKAYFKFVIDREYTALEEVKSLQKEFDIPNDKVWLMPEGVSPEQILDETDHLIEVCKNEGYKFTTRLHILTWGYKRGV